MFFKGLAFLSTLASVNPLECVSMKNQECKVRHKIVHVNANEPVFYPFSIKQVNTVVVVTISIISMQNCVYLMFLKT